MYVPRAMYSFRTSFWIVPVSLSADTPCFCPTATYIARRTEAGALIVIDVETRSSGISWNRASMSASVSIATPTFPTSPMHISLSESRPIWVGRSKATESPVEPWAEQVAVAAVGFLGRGEARVLPHCPEPPPVHGRLNAAGKGILPRESECLVVFRHRPKNRAGRAGRQARLKPSGTARSARGTSRWSS